MEFGFPVKNMASSMNFTYWFPLGEKDRKNHSRFNLLLLEDGEYYFEDWVVYFYPYPDEYSSFSLQQCLQRSLSPPYSSYFICLLVVSLHRIEEEL